VQAGDRVIVELAILDPDQREVLAGLTFEAAAEHSPEWLPTRAAAGELVGEALGEGKHARVILDGGRPVAWIGASRSWGRVWELHPLIVGRSDQQRGHGRRLVRAIEQVAIDAGALTMILGTSDSTGATTLAHVDLYVDTHARLASAKALRPHPLAFWQRVGYTVVGVVPDAEGVGLPSIQLARRLSSPA
jgi:aminoglycoside 6'-N-acetyltransferase I